MSRRFVTVWSPDWPVVAAGIPAAEPAIVLQADRVVARTRAAAAAGVAVGQRRRIAQRQCPDARLIGHDPDRDARAFEPIVRVIGRFVPRVEVVEPGWACLDAKGPSRYFGGGEAFARLLLDTIQAETGAGVDVTVGIADGRFAAAVAARRAGPEPLVVATGESPAFLAPLPVAWLHEVGDVAPELVGLFTRLGLARLGDLAAVSAGDVVARFGPAGRHAHLLAAGVDDRASLAIEPPPERGVERTFDDPVEELGPLVFTGKQLADDLVASLAAEGRVCTRLVVIAETEHGERSERAWYRASGLSAPAMVERLRWQLEGWLTEGSLTSPVVLVRLQPEEVRGDDGDQLGLWGGRSGADERAARVVTRLAGLIGDDGVLVPAWRGGRLPGDRYGWVPATSTDLTDADDTAQRLRPRLPGPWPGAVPPPSPAAVLPAVRPAELTAADGHQIRVGARGDLSAAPATLSIDGGPARKVAAWAGPWPLDERWWEPARHRRLARFQVVTADGAAHLVLAEHRRWWVAASYD